MFCYTPNYFSLIVKIVHTYNSKLKVEFCELRSIVFCFYSRNFTFSFICFIRIVMYEKKTCSFAAVALNRHLKNLMASLIQSL